MRTSLEFDVTAANHSALVTKAENEVRVYLELSKEDDLASHVDMELKVEAGQKDDYIAHVYVRIK
jgi:hypothetical protein